MIAETTRRNSEDEFRSSCKNKDKSVTAATVASNTIEASTVVASSNSTSVEAVIADVQEQVNKLSVSEITSPKTVAATTATVQVEERLKSGTKSDENRSESAIKQSTNASSYSTSSSTTTTSNADSSSNSQNKPQTFGDRMRSFLGGSSQKNVHKQKQQRKANANGILNACPGTVQGEEGWYEHGENERYYFTLNEDKWNLLYGPISEDDFEIYSKKVLDINRSIELPHTYLHKEGYYLNMDMRVKKLS
jgi:hypothetical protein